MNNLNDFIEIYKLHSDLADKMSQRRGNSNQVFISLLTGIFFLFSFVNKEQSVQTGYLNIFLGVLGILICLIWIVIIYSYRLLNAAKFKVLQELENQLPFNFFQREYLNLKKYKGYISQSYIEIVIPALFILFYSFIIVYSLTKV